MGDVLYLHNLPPYQRDEVLKRMVEYLHNRYIELLIEQEIDLMGYSEYGTTLMTDQDRLSNTLVADLVFGGGVAPHEHKVLAYIKAAEDKDNPNKHGEIVINTDRLIALVTEWVRIGMTSDQIADELRELEYRLTNG